MKEDMLKKELAANGFEWIDSKKEGLHKLKVKANKLHSVLLDGKDPVFISMPVSLEIIIDDKGHICKIKGGKIPEQQIADANKFVKTLIDTEQLDGFLNQVKQNSTHTIEVNDQGYKIIKRKKFSSF